MSRKHFAKFAVLSAIGLSTAVGFASSPSAPTYKRSEKDKSAKIVIKASLSPAGSFEGGCADKNCTGLKLADKGDKLVISIPFSSIQVGTGLVFGGRTKHMFEVFGKGNRITLSVPKKDIKLPEDGKTSSGSATGMLSLKDGGKSVSKKFSYKITRKGNSFTVKDGSFDVDVLADFGIDPKDKLKKMGVYVRPKIEVREVSFTVDQG